MQRLPCFEFRLMVLLFATAGFGAGGNRLAYLDEFCDPYYPSLDTPKLAMDRPAGITTDAGTDARLDEEASATVSPPAGAASPTKRRTAPRS